MQPKPEIPNPKHHLALKAYEEYICTLGKLFDEKEGRDLMQQHEYELDDEIRELQKIHQNCRTLSPVIQGIKEAVITNRLDALLKAKDEIHQDPRRVLIKVQKAMKPVLTDMRNERFKRFFPTGGLRESYLEKFYDEDVKNRYKPMNHIFKAGLDCVLTQKTAEARACELALIPQPLQRAKWKYMLTLADAVYNIIPSTPENPAETPAHIMLLTHFFSHMGMHERGANNRYIADTHKLRHNPAIHSLHAVTLADKIFSDARLELIAYCNGDRKKRDELLEQWSTVRERAMFMALLHDAGEFHGEIKQGIDLSGLPRAEQDAFREQAVKDERETMVRCLEKPPASMKIDPKTWDILRAKYLKEFDRAEKTDVFIGLFVKVLEKMQTQHDFEIYDGKSGAPRLATADEDYKIFSLKYASNPMAGRAGKKSLSDLITQSSNENKNTLYGFLYTALEKEFKRFMKDQIAAYQPQASYADAALLSKTPDVQSPPHY